MTTGTDRTLSFVIPVWNEAEGIDRTIAATLDAGSALVANGTLSDFEVVLVDDGSTDGTSASLDRLADIHDELVVLHHDHNHGVGRAMRSGFTASRGALVLYTDADLPVDLAATSRIVDTATRSGCALVAGYRRRRAVDGPRRLVFSLAWNLVVQAVLRLSLKDVNFAFKLMKGPIVRSLPLRSDGPLIDVELLAMTARAGYAIEQEGFDYQPRAAGMSSMTSPGVGWAMLRELLSRRRELRP